MRGAEGRKGGGTTRHLLLTCCLPVPGPWGGAASCFPRVGLREFAEPSVASNDLASALGHHPLQVTNPHPLQVTNPCQRPGSAVGWLVAERNNCMSPVASSSSSPQNTKQGGQVVFWRGALVSCWGAWNPGVQGRPHQVQVESRFVCFFFFFSRTQELFITSQSWGEKVFPSPGFAEGAVVDGNTHLWRRRKPWAGKKRPQPPAPLLPLAPAEMPAPASGSSPLGPCFFNFTDAQLHCNNNHAFEFGWGNSRNDIKYYISYIIYELGFPGTVLEHGFWCKWFVGDVVLANTGTE